MDEKKMNAVLEAVSCENQEVFEAIIEAIVRHHGPETMTTVAIEECAEFIQALTKAKRGDYDKAHITEEMADVYIILWELHNLFNISTEDLNRWIEHKLYRELVRSEIEPF